MRKPPNSTWRWIPGVIPFHSAPIPSSAATARIVPSIPAPRPRVVAVAVALAPRSCSRTLTVSRGIVQNSANDAENALAARPPRKGFTSGVFVFVLVAVASPSRAISRPRAERATRRTADDSPARAPTDRRRDDAGSIEASWLGFRLNPRLFLAIVETPSRRALKDANAP